jgi:hypothetical protein
MRNQSWKRGTLLVVFAASLAACSESLTTPSIATGDDASGDRATAGSPARTPEQKPDRPTVTPTRDPAKVDTRRTNCDDGLTPEQIARIRALYNEYLDAIAPYVRLIQEVQQEAREAHQAGASRERIAEILAQADRAKQAIAELTARLRAAIQAITGRNDLPCWVVVKVV